MPEFSVHLRSIPDSKAAIGWAGDHTIVVDRPHGRAGGMGLGFNGGQLLAIAIGGCLCNDLRYVAEKQGVAIRTIAVDVALTLAGEPPIATGAEVTTAVTAEDDAADIDALLAEVQRITAVGNSVQRGFPLSFIRAR